MAAVLGAVFVALALSAALGFVIGVRYARTVTITATVDDGSEPAEVADEPDLADRLQQAEADLVAHAQELRDANEEITCLLEQLHEARSDA